MENADRFTDLYKVLEDLLEEKYRSEGRPVTNTVYQFICDKESAPFREKLDLCRQVRNLLTHSADIGGHAPVEPSDELMRALENVVEYLRRPPLAFSRATPLARLLKASADDRVVWLMKRMLERGFSHAPVLCGARLTGVFSVSTPFSWLMSGAREDIREDTRVRDILPILRPEAHGTERFLFAGPETTEPQAREMFARRSPREKRAATIFVTEDGGADAPLLGMLTPWDLMEN